MFSQFRQAVESLAQPPRRSGSVDETARALSPDGTSTSGSTAASSTSSSWAPLPLTDSAAALSNIANLRKLPFGQRSASPAPVSRSATPVAGAQAQEKEPQASSRRRPNLEERLKARFAIGDASPGDTPDASGRTTPLPPVHPMSPTSTPLPDSPVISPIITPADDSQVPRASLDALALPPPFENVDGTRQANAAAVEGAVEHATAGVRHFEAGIPLPPFTPSERGDPLDSIAQPHRITPSPLGSDRAIHESISRGSGYATTPEVTVAAASPELEGMDPLNVAPATPRLASTPGTTRDTTPSSDPTPIDISSPPALKELSSSPPTVNTQDSIPGPADNLTTSNASLKELAEELSSGNSKSPASTPEEPAAGVAVDALQERLRLIEQRFSDVSTSFKKLQAEKRAADKVLQELTTVSSVQDVGSLRDYLQNITLKTEMSQDEIKRLSGKLTRQEERLEELRDIHHMEAKSQTDLIDKLRKQLEDGQASMKASQDSTAKVEEEFAKRKAEVERAQTDAEKARTAAKEEEEKRTKAISLLKTVRQKLVKTEKERDDALKDAGAGRDKEREEREKEKAERARLQAEIDKVNSERDKAIMGMKAHFDREIANTKDRHEKEMAALKGQFEIEAAAAKASYSKELSGKDVRVSTLEKSIQNLTQEKNRLFEQLQVRQAEFESSQAHLEALQSQTAELNYQLREAGERNALVFDELTEARRALEARSHGASASAEDSARALTLAEARFDARLADARARLQAAERDRNDAEGEWALKLDEKTTELDTLRKVVERSAKSKENEKNSIAQARAESDRLREEIRGYQEQITALRRQADKVTDIEDSAKENMAQFTIKFTALQKSLEDSKGREAQLRSGNKTLREELRKVQTSAALLERQRNPGVGYWSAGRTEGSAEVHSPRSSSDVLSHNGSTRSDSPAPPARNEEEVNLEYVRNIILQFLEHKDMRPNLVRVLSAVLRFTPQETRRLIAKV